MHLRPEMIKRWAISVVVIATLLLAMAGRLDLPRLWAFIITWSVLSFYAISTMEPDLARERYHPPSPGADPVALRFARMLALVMLIVAVLDVGRLHWSDTVPVWLSLLSLAIVAVAFGLVFWAMRVNRFFSAVVRVQTDRGHHVVDQGPYAHLRHPGYLGMVVGAPLVATALGSWLALVPGVAYAVLMVRRVALEDRFLQRELPGYREYAERVPYRLIPGAW